MKVIVAGTIIMVLILTSVLWAKGVPKSSLAFNVKEANRIRCRISPSDLGGWNLTVLAQNSHKHLIMDFLYSVRKHMKASMQDCRTWMKAVKEAKKEAWTKHTTHVNTQDPPKAKPTHGK